MFGNLVNTQDLRLVREKIADGKLKQVLSRLLLGKRAKVVRTWQSTGGAVGYYDLPAMK